MIPAKKNLDHIQKLVIVAAVACKINHVSNRMPDRGWREIAHDMNVCEMTIRNIWSQYKRDIANHVAHKDIVKPRKKARYDSQSQCDQDTMTSIDTAILKRDGYITYRELQLDLEESQVFVSLSQVYSYCQQIGVIEESSYIKPRLTDKHRRERVMFVLNKIDSTDPNNLVYYDHQNIVSIDEKWFRTDPLRKTLKYLPDHDRHLNNSTQHKSHIPHLMVTAAISEPTNIFDGKVGLIYHGDLIPAQRNSPRRPAGTLEIHSKTVDSEEFFESQTKFDVNLEQTGILDMIIRRKVPEEMTYIQMDNAPAHGKNTQAMLNEYCDDENLMIEYTTQPAQSPDFNICDLAIFNSLQKRADRLKKQSDHSIDGLWTAVQDVFREYPKETIQICYGHLYANYIECLKHDGDNRYKNPHDHVRSKFSRGESLNSCCLSLNEYVNLRHETVNWLLQNR